MLNILATQTSSQPLKVEVHTRKSCDEGPVPGLGSHHARRRTSKDRQMLTGDAGPPTEKKARSNQENGSRANSPQPTSSTKSKSGGKGGKGIRNRVFCGDCPGCLKNDDCGQCRYCRDKTKFGGQNRLRQKCLHRRCQMDTHRRSSSQNTQNSHHHQASGNVVTTSSVNSSFSDNIAATNLSRQSPR